MDLEHQQPIMNLDDARAGENSDPPPPYNWAVLGWRKRKISNDRTILCPLAIIIFGFVVAGFICAAIVMTPSQNFEDPVTLLERRILTLEDATEKLRNWTAKFNETLSSLHPSLLKANERLNLSNQAIVEQQFVLNLQ